MNQTNTSETQSEQASENSCISIQKNLIVELYSILLAEGMWGLLTPDAQAYGEVLYKEVTGNDLSAPPAAMKYSIEQHLDLIDRVLPGHSKATDFWQQVVRIVWFVMLIEKNPLIAAEIRGSKNPQDLSATIETRSNHG